jgi:hypothetical protein
MKRFLWLFAVLLTMASIAHAATVTQHAIQVDVDTQGFGHITEKFIYSFDTEQQLIAFRSQAQKLGANLDAWRSYDSTITNYVGAIRPGSGRIGYEETEGDRFVKLEYTTAAPLFTKTETARQTEYSIDSRSFASFQQGSVYVIPSNTKIIFSLPKQATIQLDSLKPEIEDPNTIQQTQTEKRIFWAGHLTISGNLGLTFTLDKQIASPTSLTQTLKTMIENRQAYGIAAVILVIASLVYFKRKSIQGKIENYLVEHSEIEHTKESEELEIEE